MTPELILSTLREHPGHKLEHLPSTSGLYALRDHRSAIRYIGIGHSEGFRKRIRNKHTTGSEDRSHKFSAAYNSGRLWRDRHGGDARDGKASKQLRNKFILKHCSASIFPILEYPNKSFLEQFEARVISLATPEETRWNTKNFPVEAEPAGLIDDLIRELGLSSDQIASIERQALRFKELRQ